MIRIRRSEERGHLDHGWLDTYHTFSFGRYHDPEHMGFRVLRVINEDYVAPRTGFDTHPHEDMEILTYVLEGAVEHRDSTGNEGVIPAGEMQRMTAGTGIRHSEKNPFDERLHLMQIWILPEERGLEPGYEQKALPADERRNRLQLIAAPDGAGDAMTIHQDVSVYATVLDAGREVEHALGDGRHAWVQVARGSVNLNGESLRAGDGAALSDEPRVTLRADEEAEVLLFDLP